MTFLWDFLVLGLLRWRICSVPVSTFVNCTKVCVGMFLIKERQETYEPRRNVNASFISLIIFHVSFQVMVFHWCLFWCSKLKAQRRERRKTGAKADHTSEAEDAMVHPWMPWRLFGGLHSVRFDPPPREPKGPKVSLPEKLPEVSIELPIEKEGKEEDFRKFPTVLNTLKIDKSKNGVNVWQNFTFFTI